MPIQFTTHSGFLKLEVYKELDTAIEEQNYEKACYLSAELACTRGEIAPLLDHMLGGVMSKQYLSSNAWMLLQVAGSIALVRTLPKRDMHVNPAFQKALCELVISISMQGKRNHSDMATQLGTIEYHESVEPLLYQFQDTPIPVLEAIFQNKVSNELLKMFKLLFWLILHKKSTHAMQVAAYLMQSKEYFVDDLSYHEIDDSIKKASRKDIVWYIWRLLLIFVSAKKDMKPEVGHYIRSALALYIFQFKKRVRQDRINLLYFAVFVASARQGKNRPPNFYERLAKEAASQIGIVYHDILVGAAAEGEGAGADADTDTTGAADALIDDVIDAHAHADVYNTMDDAPQRKKSVATSASAAAAATAAPTDYLMAYTERDDHLIDILRRERESMRRKKSVDAGQLTRVLQI